MIRSCFLTLLLPLALAAETPAPSGEPQKISDLIVSAPVVTFATCPDKPQILAAYFERDPQWSGRLKVYHKDEVSVLWQYAYPKSYEEYRGHYVVSFRWVTLKQTSNPVLEVIDSTHMGNGCLSLWEVEGQDLRLLLRTKIRGRFWSPPSAFEVPLHGEAFFKKEQMKMDYQRSPNLPDSICLTGSITRSNDMGEELPLKKFEQISIWDPKERIFVAQEPTSP